jgi:hypothetical protein
LSELLRNTIGVMPGLSSYRDLNGWIRALLRLSETQDITVEDISENETP